MTRTITATRRLRLKVLRAERELTQIAVAHGAGMNVTRYWHIEKGNVDPTSDEIESLAKVFGVPAKRLGLARQDRKAS